MPLYKSKLGHATSPGHQYFRIHIIFTLNSSQFGHDTECQALSRLGEKPRLAQEPTCALSHHRQEGQVVVHLGKELSAPSLISADLCAAPFCPMDEAM